MTAVVILLAIVFVVVVFVLTSVRMIRPFQRGLVERLGKYHDTLSPGLRIVLPFIDRVTVVDMREVVVDVPPQEVITSDNVVVNVDAVVYYEPTDPQRLIYNVRNFMLAITKLAQTNLRNVIGDMALDQATTSRDIINTKLREILDDATDKWGARVVRVEIQRIDPPPDVVDAMHHQMKAERTRRAVTTEARGAQEAAVTRAEGERQAAVLSAEGRKQAQILEAEGQAEATRAMAEAERFRQQAVAEGEADAIRSIYQAIHDGRPTQDLLAIKYLESLEAMANGQATKIVIPTEASALLGALGGLAEMMSDGNGKVPAGAPAGADAGDEFPRPPRWRPRPPGE